MTPGYVPPIGPLDAKIMLIGEAPGEEEVSKGEPFCGPSGRLLKSMLGNCGIDFRACYTTNVVKQRPPHNDFGVFYVDQKTRKQPSPFLLQSIQDLTKEIERVNPNIIVPLGGEALRALTGKSSISKWRGSLLQYRQWKLLPTLHPAYVAWQYTERVTVELDLKRVSKESVDKTLSPPKHTFITAPTFSQVREFLSERPDKLSFDIETSGRHVRCLGLSSSPSTAICIPFMAKQPEPSSTLGSIIHFGLVSPPPTTASYWSPEEEYEILRLLNDLFSDPSVKKIAQNFPFDALVLSREFGIDTSPGLWMDTMVAHHTCYSELPKGLDYLASIYTRIPYYSDFDAGDDRQTWIYNCYDAAATLEIANVLWKEMSDLGVLDFYNNKVQPALLAYTRAETRGVLVDQVERSRVANGEPEKGIEGVIQRRDRLGKLTTEASGGIIVNPNSPDQQKKYIYGTLGIPAILAHKPNAAGEKNPTMDKHAREKLREKNPQHAPFFNLLDAFTKDSTLIEGLLSRELVDGRVKTHYNKAGTVTGRLSSGKDKELGAIVTQGAFGPVTNLQNVDRGELRRMFIPDPGWLFIKADLSQAEFRIVAWAAGIRSIIEKYLENTNYDVHRMVASLIFKLAEDVINKEQRYTAKNGVYGGQYDMFYTTAARTYKLSMQMAKYVLDEFHKLFPEIRANFHAYIKNEVKTKRYIINPVGRKRYFFDRLDDGWGRENGEVFRAAYSDFAQSTVGCLIDEAFVKADREWNHNEAFPLLQVHDEIVAMVREGKEIEYAEKLKTAMEIPIQVLSTPEPLIIPAEVGIGKNWYDIVPLEKYKET